MTETWDWIVAGAGHNGLTAAAYLARAGERVLALDQDVVVGGGATTKEVTLPGYLHNLHAMRILPWNQVPDELDLWRHGLEFTWDNRYAANVYADGRALVRYVDIEQCVREIARFSERDARTYRDLFFATKGIRERARLRRLGWPTPPAGPPPIDPANGFTATLARWSVMSQVQVINELFENEQVRVSMRGSLQTVGFPGDIPLTGLNVCTGMLSLHENPASIIKGGTWQYARALREALHEAGGVTVTSAKVREIVVRDGQARGVVLDDGRSFEAEKGVIAGFGHKVLLDVLDTTGLPIDFVEPIQRFRGEELVIFAVHAAVDGLVSYRAASDNPDVDGCLDVTWGLESVMDMIKGYNDGREGALPRVMAGFCDIPSRWDPSYAPPGKSVIDIGIIVPYRLADGGPEAWDREKDGLAERALEAWLATTTLRRDQVLGTFVYSPMDIVRSNPAFVEASPVQGSPLPDQAGIFRPAYGWAEYATPVQGLYVTGGSAWPMGGLNGIPGHHCATRIAEDYAIPQWWAPVPGREDKRVAAS